jgi:hypothetical protein
MNKVILASVLTAASAFAHAESQVHLLGSLGVANYDISEDEIADLYLNEGFNSVQGELDDSPVMFKIGAGFALNENVSIEAAYTNLGTVEFDVLTTGPTASFDTEIETTGFEGSLVGKHEINEDVHLVGRLGLYAWETEFESTGASGSFSATSSGEVDGTDVTFGGGIQFKDWRLEYQRYTLDDQDVDTVQLSYVFNL